MKRFKVAVLCAVASAGVFALVQAVLAQAPRAPAAQQAKPAPKDLATLIQAGDSKLALQQIQAGSDVNRAQPDGTSPLLWAVDRTDYDVAAALIAKKADPNATNAFGANPLTEAARQSDERLVKLLLDAGAKVDSRNPDGETALMMALKGGDLAIVQMLVNAGANVNAVEQFHKQTPLMYAVASNRSAAAMTKLLLSKGADVKPRAMYSDWDSQITSEPRAQYRPVGGLNALLYASRSGCYECVEGLLAAGADVNLPTPEGVTPLMIALDNQHNEVAKLLMDKGANINLWDWWGRTALWIAVDRKTPPGGGGGGGGFGGGGGRRGGGGGGQGGGARGGGGGGARGGRGGGGAGGGALANADEERPKGVAAVSSMDIINALLDAGVNQNPEMNFHRPNAPGRGRFGDNEISTDTTPLFRAVQNNDLEAVKVLLEKGADPNINTMGYTAFLLSAGAGPGGRGGNGQANTQIMDLMLQHSADVNAKVSGTKTYSFNVSRENMGNKDALSKEGTTALHEAARGANAEIVKYLLAHGANPNLLDADGKRPIDLVGAPRASRGGNAVAAAGRGGRGGGGRGPSPAAIAEVRALLEAASAKK